MRIIAAISSGILLAASFPSIISPSFHHYGGYLVWVALVPLLLADRELDGRRSFLLGYLQGLVFYMLLLYWIGEITEMTLAARYGAYAALVLYLSIYHGLFNMLRHRLEEAAGLGLLLLPVLWTALEYLRGFFLSGFPWGTLGYAPYHFKGLLKLASLGGVYTLSFLVVAGNVLVYSLFTLRGKGAWRRPLSLALLFVGFIFVAGRLPDALMDQRRPVRLALLQGNVNQSQKWSPHFKNENFVLYGELQKSARGADLIVWPESGATCYFSREPYYAERVKQMVNVSGSWTVIGAPRFQQGKGKLLNHNAALLFAPHRGIVDEYYKMHLVPFGEYVPLSKFLPFGKVVEDLGAGDFTPGEEVAVMKTSRARFSTTICYEVIFPRLVRRFVKGGAEFIVNITNDGWYGRSAMSYQHAMFCVLRAVENGVYLARCANSGISCIISPRGEILAPSGLFERKVVRGTVYPRKRLTFYSRFGDIFAWLMLLISGGFVWLSYRKQ